MVEADDRTRHIRDAIVSAAQGECFDLRPVLELVRAEECEACAKVAQELEEEFTKYYGPGVSAKVGFMQIARQIKEAILKRNTIPPLPPKTAQR